MDVILDKTKLPAHVGVIMDGNGRWAEARGMSRVQGHRAGTERLRGVVRLSSDLGVRVLSVYAFSTENWKRPGPEVEALMGLLREYFTREIDELHANRVRIRILGDAEGLGAPVRSLLDAAVERTRENDGLQFNIAFNYGGRAELVRAARLLAEAVRAGEIDPADIDEQALLGKLYTAGQPDPDLIIRTGGEKRLSNFLLMQSSYAELYFTDDYWPDFSDDKYLAALADYASRKRRFGDVK